MLAKSTPRLVSRKWLSLHLFLLIAIVILSSIGNLPVAQASGGLPSSVYDQDEVDWASVRNYTSAAFSDDFQTRKSQGDMVIDLEVAELSGQQRVSAVWQKNTDGRGWASLRNLTSDQFSTEWKKYLDQGYRLIDQESYVLNGTRYYSGVWTENKEGLAWASYRNVDSIEFSNKFQQYRDAGFIPVDVEGYAVGSSMRYSAIWVKNVEGLAWKLRRDMSSAQYGDYFQQYKDEYRVHDIESYLNDGSQNYAAIWYENKNNRYWKAIRDMTAKQYGDTWAALRDEGYRLTDFEIYPSNSGTRYAGVWRQNTIRPSWQHREAVDAVVGQAMTDFDIPGMSVAVAHQGEFTYLRGFGYADIDNDKRATSRTVYRIASVSKALAGVLALDLEEAGEIDLDEDTRTYVPFMPAHHTHKVWQTIANRAGIGHYSDYANVDTTMYTHYNSAVQAANLFWDDPLIYDPGSGYKYSTPAYTLLGTAIEGAVGFPIETVLKQELADKYNLPTILAEDRSQPNSNRAALYSWQGGQNVEWTDIDDLSWKVLGGGIEASAYDLGRFGIKLVNGSILSEDSRNTLWTQPDGFSNYAYGWNTGDDQCTAVVAKAGGQPGAKSYIRIYPELEIVIVVLSNRWTGDHSAVQLARDIGTIMLNAECNTSSAVLFQGMNHNALGTARLALYRDRIILSNIGATGDDGVSIDLGRARAWNAKLDVEFERTGRAVLTAVEAAPDGAPNGGKENPVSTLILSNSNNERLSLASTFETKTYKVEYLRQGKVVAEETGLPNGTQAVLIDWDEINCLLNGGFSFMCSLAAEFRQSDEGLCLWEVAFNTVLTLPGQTRDPIQYDTLRLIEEEDPDHHHDPELMIFSKMLIQGSNLSSLTLVEEGREPDEHTIFLPLVIR